MAKIVVDDKETDLPDDSSISEVCESLGVEFGCKNGFCRTCEVTILEGYDNLTELSESEEFIGLIKPRRLACQCKIKSGIVKIKLE